MADYIEIIGRYFPNTEATCDGDSTVYANIVFLGSPAISQATLDSYETQFNTETPPDNVETIVAPAGSPQDGDVLSFDYTAKLWRHNPLPTAGISAYIHDHGMEDLLGFDVASVVVGDVLVATGSPIMWWSTSLAKSNISDFSESDYVHVTGDETIGGDKHFTGSLTIDTNVLVYGNVTVQGTVNFTNSTTVDIGDNIILLNSGEYGPTPTLDAGIEVQRGWASIGSPIGSPINYGSPIVVNPNARLIFEEATDTWKVDPATGTLTAISLLGHTHVEADITDFGTYLTGITGQSIGSLSDVTVTSVASGEILKWSGSAWINNTLAEAAIAPATHTHAQADITDLGAYYVSGDSPTFTTTTTTDVVVTQTATFDAEYSNGNSGSSKTINWNNGNKQYVTLSASCTFSFTDPPGPCNLILRVYQNSSYSLNFPGGVKWAGGSEMECTIGTGSIDIYMFYFDGSTYYGSAVQDFS